jgi:hypothetical protein
MGDMRTAPDRDPFAFLNCSGDYRTARRTWRAPWANFYGAMP